MIWLHIALITLLVGTSLFFLVLDLLNFQYGKEEVQKKTDWLKNKFDIEDTERLLNYQRLKTGFGQVQSFVGLTLLLFVLYSGLFSWGVNTIHELNLGMVWEGILFFMVISVVSTLYALPFSAFQTFVIEELFDFNQQTPGLWLRDKAKGLLITLIFTAVLAGPILFFIDLLPNTWWLAGWALVVLFGFAMQIIYPRVIAPLFNEFQSIEEGELREAVNDVFDRAGFECSQIYTMDASKRSSHSNAYFTGFGRTKRVVLFDTLLDQMNIPQVQGVLAHELAHWKKGHIWWRIGRQAVKTGILFSLLFFLTNAEWLYDMFAVSTEFKDAGLVLAGLWLSPISSWIAPLENWFSINDEREADRFAAEVMDSEEPLVEALYNLVGENLSNPFPHPLYAAFHYHHPPVPDRVRYLQEELS